VCYIPETCFDGVLYTGDMFCVIYRGHVLMVCYIQGTCFKCYIPGTCFDGVLYTGGMF
jgi:hypothetical protein